MTNFSDGGVDAVVGVEVDALPPQSLDDLLAADQSSIFPDQQDQQIHGDAFHAHGFPRPSQFITAHIQNELSELDSFRRHSPAPFNSGDCTVLHQVFVSRSYRQCTGALH